MDIKEHSKAFIKEELEEAVERLSNKGIIYECDYKFTWQHLINYHFDDIEERLKEYGLRERIAVVCDMCGESGFMFGIYNTNIFNIEEAKELLYKEYYK